MERYNVIWILVDSVRRYESTPEAIKAGDDRSRLDYMDEFAREGTEFVNTVTSAPSTFQSLSASATGMHSYHVNRNFDDFIFDQSAFPSIGQILRDDGYHDYAFLMHRVTREVLRGLFPMIPRRLWPKGLSHKKWWSNSDIYRAIEKTLANGVQKPAFFFVDYNCRKDPKTNDIVKNTVKMFREAGFTRDNSILMLCSDHGYPDPSKNMGPEFHKRNRLTHDVVLTDDNIMIPLTIQYPGCPAGTKVETTIATVDMFPTILDILGKPIHPRVHGKSLLPLVNGDREYRQMMEGRFHRCDSRLQCQEGRGTVIRNGRYKYVFYHDDSHGRNEEFFDICNDELERTDLIDSQNSEVKRNLEIFRGQFQASEQEAESAQLSYLFKKFSDNYAERVTGAERILITDSCSPVFLHMLATIVRKANEKATISVLFVEHEPSSLEGAVVPIDAGVRGWHELTRGAVRKLLAGNSFDVLLAPFNTSERRDNASLAHALKGAKASHRVFLDYNMGCFAKSISYEWRLFKAAWPFVRYEPVLCAQAFCRFLLKAVERTRIGAQLRKWIDPSSGKQPNWKEFEKRRYTVTTPKKAA